MELAGRLDILRLLVVDFSQWVKNRGDQPFSDVPHGNGKLKCSSRDHQPNSTNPLANVVFMMGSRLLFAHVCDGAVGECGGL